MRHVVFIAPFPLETTMRFARAAARLDGVRFTAVMQELPRGEDARTFDDAVRVEDGLDTGQLVHAVEQLARRNGRPHRILGILEALQEQLAAVRQKFGVPGTNL